MIAGMIGLIVFAGLFFLFVFAVRPDGRRREACLTLARRNFAHRGLWDLSKGIAENSMPAFEAAVRSGYGIELDVHLSKDGMLVVFHDDTLQRVCQTAGSVEGETYARLSALSLFGTPSHMPLLSEVLDLVGGRVPLLIELKQQSLTSRSLCEKTASLLSSYRGEYLIESFNPFVLLWFRRHRPEVLRGQLSSRYGKNLAMNPLVKLASTTLVENILSRPHFIAYNHKTDDVFGLKLCRSLFKIPCFAWTIRSEKEADVCKPRYDAIIFERFLPGLPETDRG